MNPNQNNEMKNWADQTQADKNRAFQRAAREMGVTINQGLCYGLYLKVRDRAKELINSKSPAFIDTRGSW